MDNTFSALGIGPELSQTLAQLGYEEPTAIQREAIPPLLAGRDIIGQASTGTGKTAAFALPILEKCRESFNGKKTVALVLVPTRELAMQVAEAVHSYGKALGVRVLPIYGGQSMEPQLRGLQRGAHVVVATPGRALDHLRRKTLRLEDVQVVVLDEADEMLDMGFAEDLEAILSTVPDGAQTALFSATMPSRISHIAEKHLTNPARVTIAKATTVYNVPLVRQLAYFTSRHHKMATLERVLDMEEPASALVFCRTRIEVDELSERMNAHGRRAEALHGGLSQMQRDKVMKKFRDGSAELLIATDVAARGLDIKHLSHVINYDLPEAPEAYVHRIGLTGRAGKSGVAILLVEPREARNLRYLEKLTKQKIEERKIPTVADLRVKRLDVLKLKLEEQLASEDLDVYHKLIESLGDTHDPATIAAAALKLADGGGREEPVVEIPHTAPQAFAAQTAGPARGASRDRDRDSDTKFAKLYVAVGREAGVQPLDIIGALRAGLGKNPRAIGRIEIHDRHTVVEVPEDIAEQILSALRHVAIRGQQARARRFRDT